MVSEAPAPRRWASRAKWGIALGLLAIAAFVLWSRGGNVFGKQYEYEEDLTLSLDGSAMLTINSSIAALVALRGLDLDPSASTVDRDRVRALYEAAGAEVISVPRPWRRAGRQFVQINLRVADVRQLQQITPLSWSRYELTQQGEEHTFRQSVGASAMRPGTLKNYGWTGDEIVAFRVHLPSRILEHNARDLETDVPTGIRRGNILAWEQHLADRLDGKPVQISVRMESQSILYRTLWLFAAAFGAALLALAALIWWFMRRGQASLPTSSPS